MTYRLPSNKGGTPWNFLHLPDENTSQITKTLGTIISHDQSHACAIYGAAFIIGSFGSHAICLCAAHSLRDALRHQKKKWEKIPNLPTHILQLPRTDTDHLVASVIFPETEKPFPIKQICYSNQFDIAVIIIEKKSHFDFSAGRFAINYSAPSILDVATFICYETKIFNIPENEADGHIKFQQELMCRGGVVSDINYSQTYLRGLGPHFSTTVPTLPGMSGSPVCVHPEENRPFEICGVVSTDDTKEEPHSTNKPGNTKVSLIWPTLFLGIKARLVSTKIKLPHSNVNKFYTLYDLANLGLIDNQTTNTDVEVTRFTGRTKIKYSDRLHGSITMNFEIESDVFE